MKKAFVLLCTVLLFAVGCTDRDDSLATINLRIKNTSSINFDKVQVGAEEFTHSNIAPDAYSEYLVYKTVYEYSYIEIKSGEETYIFQPTDFVGETPLGIGFYTYKLDVTEEGEVTLTFNRD